jgi:bifunctional pyridoxal-dependent enzyme with beta-cystathionase and maltose regulon repressor activities
MAMRNNGRQIIKNNLVIKNGRYEIDFDDLEAKARLPQAKALLFCSPHNPVGRVWTVDELRRVGEICLRNGVIVISDEIHFDIIMPAFAHQVFAALDEKFAANTITCTSPSKTFNIPGLGGSNVIIADKTLRSRYVSVFNQTATHPGLNNLAYKATEIAYTACESWLDELLLVLDHNRALTEAFFASKIPAITAFPMEGSYLQWWDCRGLGMDYRQLEDFLTKKAHLFLSEGYIFGENGQGFERINLACPESTLKAALDRLSAALMGEQE